MRPGFEMMTGAKYFAKQRSVVERLIASSIGVPAYFFKS